MNLLRIRGRGCIENQLHSTKEYIRRRERKTEREFVWEYITDTIVEGLYKHSKAHSGLINSTSGASIQRLTITSQQLQTRSPRHSPSPPPIICSLTVHACPHRPILYARCNSYAQRRRLGRVLHLTVAPSTTHVKHH